MLTLEGRRVPSRRRSRPPEDRFPSRTRAEGPIDSRQRLRLAKRPECLKKRLHPLRVPAVGHGPAAAALHLCDDDVAILNTIDYHDIDLANACLTEDVERREQAFLEERRGGARGPVCQ